MCNEQKRLLDDGAYAGALFSDDRMHRYSLWRVWLPEGKQIAFIGLNPSTADEHVDDPTVRRCIGYSKRWGFGGMYMLNLFAYRATDPRDMLSAPDPFGPDNLHAIVERSKRVDMVLCCWGNHGLHMGRAFEVVDLLEDAGVELRCIGLTKTGQPKHPLYCPNKLQPIPYSGTEIRGQ